MKLQKTVSLKSKNNSKLKFSDLSMLDILLKTGISLHDSLSIIENRSNKYMINIIKKRLDDGENVKNVFNDYLRNSIKDSLLSFMLYLPFNESLSLALSIYTKETTLKKKIYKNLAYPIMLMAFAVVGIYLFNAYCFGPLIKSFNDFNTDLSLLLIFKSILDLFITCLLIVILVILSLILFFMQKKRLILAYTLLEKYLPNSRFEEYLSSRFILYFNECHKVGLKTKDSIEVLKSFKYEPLISFIAFHIDDSFMSGKDLSEAMTNKYLDERLKIFIKIAINTAELNTMLEGYIAQFEDRFAKFTENISKTIQIISYSLIGVVIIFIYQLLFIPMRMIGGL